jgi:hypothetical protein
MLVLVLFKIELILSLKLEMMGNFVKIEDKCWEARLAVVIEVWMDVFILMSEPKI